MPNEISEMTGPLKSAGAKPLSVSGGPLPELIGVTSQIAWATQIRAQVSVSFERIATAVLAGTNRYKGLEPAEIETLLAAVEQHRLNVLRNPEARYFLDH